MSTQDDLRQTLQRIDGRSYKTYKDIQGHYRFPQQHQQERQREGGETFGSLTPRIPLPRSLDPRKGRRDVSVKTRGLRMVQFGEEMVDLGAVAQLVDDSQTRALAAALVYGWAKYMDGKRSVTDILTLIMADIEQHGLDILDKRQMGDWAAFRIFELGAALNRLRTLQIQ